MCRQLKAIILICILLVTMVVPTGVVFASERITYGFESGKGGGGTYNVYSTFAALGTGTYVSFEVKIPKAGNYSISVNIGTEAATSLGISTDTVDIGTVNVDTGGTSVYKDYELATVYFKEGSNKITIKNMGSMTVTVRNLYLDEAVGGSVDFSKKTGVFKKHVLPTNIEAEDFDFNSGVSGVGADIIKQTYRKESPIQIVEELSAVVVNSNAGDTMEYTFEVKKSALYDISIISTSSGKARLYFDGGKGYVEGLLYAREPGSFGTAYLTEGTHKVKLEVLKKGTNIDKLSFKSSKNQNDYYNSSDLASDKKIVIEKEEVSEEPNPVWKNIYVDANAVREGNGSKASPYKSIQAAKEAVKKLSDSMKGDIVVNIASGTYFIDEKLEFGVEDSGKNGYNIVYRGESEGDKPIISGGKKIGGWQKMENGIWYAKADDSIEVMRQLYINELPARMARSKYQYRGTDPYDNPDTDYQNDGYYIPKKNFPVLSNTEDMELLYIYDWAMSYFPVDKITDAGENWLIEYEQPFFQRYYNGTYDHGRPGASVKLYLLNAPELIDEYGEFYFDKKTKTVYYYAYPEENMETAEVYTPYCEGLVNVSGESAGSRVNNIVFDNLDFRLGAWNDISRTGMLNGQGDSMIPPDLENNTVTSTWQKGWFPSVFEVNFADGISVENPTGMWEKPAS
ncbi:MAG: hypothetical protein IJX95_07410, partial [Lachnospiraceae bacterium]|nr:hypothetical protein [Lachnospiraceae bacterium]